MTVLTPDEVAAERVRRAGSDDLEAMLSASPGMSPTIATVGAA